MLRKTVTRKFDMGMPSTQYIEYLREKYPLMIFYVSEENVQVNWKIGTGLNLIANIVFLIDETIQISITLQQFTLWRVITFGFLLLMIPFAFPPDPNLINGIYFGLIGIVGFNGYASVARNDFFKLLTNIET